MTAIAHQPHPVTRALAGVRDQLAAVAGVPVWSMDPAETTATLAEVQSRQGPAGRARRPSSWPMPTGSTSPATPAPPRPRTGTPTAPGPPAPPRTGRCGSPPASRTTTRPGPRSPQGRVHVEQAEAILRALTELPADLDPEVLEKAEQHLLELAADHDAKALKHLGRRILEVVSPDAADAHEAALLEREERDAAAATRLTMWDDGHGKVHGRFTLDALTGAMLKKALLRLRRPQTPRQQRPLGRTPPHPRAARPGASPS